MAKAQKKILADRRETKPPAVADLVKMAAARAGTSPSRIFREMIALGMRRNGVSQHEFFNCQLYRPDLSRAEKREFLGEMGSYRLNLRLSPPNLTRMRGFLNDKITHTALWKAWGIPTTETQAAFAPDRWLGPIPALHDTDEIIAFLTQNARFPLFCKPIAGLQALGSVCIDGVDAAGGTAHLANGETVSISDLADEITRDFPEGYMFQSAVTQDPTVTAIAGRTLSCVRFVTVIREAAPEVLYASWKIASPTAMADNFWQEGSMLARVDAESGVVQNCVLGKGPEAREIETHPVSGKPIVGYRIPHWEAAKKLVLNAHAIFPINGCLGWDVGIGADGPVIIECNDNPGAEFYQLVAGRGMMNDTMRPILDKVIARNKKIAADKRRRLYKLDL